MTTPAGTLPTREELGLLLASVPDPELPFLTIEDLGILRGWEVDGSAVRVQITPTYSGCPALDTIREDVAALLWDAGFSEVVVETVLSPPWTTGWLSERGRAALADHGYAPPGPVFLPLPQLSEPQRVGARPGSDSSLVCPQCGSHDTEELARFGATACKALHRCRSCREPFEHFKAH